MHCVPPPPTTGHTHTIALDHHIYNKLNDCWIKQPSKPQPYITLTAACQPEDYTALGFKPTTKRSKEIEVSAMADTGCQSCLASMKIIERLGLQKNDLIPVTMRMHAANNNGIKILGAVIMRFTGRSKTGKKLENQQVVYVTRDSDKLFLSRETCTALGIITKDFSTIGEALHVGTDDGTNQKTQAENLHSQPGPTCDCPRRQRPPPKPSKLPYPATAANRKRLEQWLREYYKSSTFNTCTHQPLPLMEVPPMRLMIDKNAEPVAHHTPIPVPLHWQAGGHRMVICAKNG